MLRVNCEFVPKKLNTGITPKLIQLQNENGEK